MTYQPDDLTTIESVEELNAIVTAVTCVESTHMDLSPSGKDVLTDSLRKLLDYLNSKDELLTILSKHQAALDVDTREAERILLRLESELE